MSESRFSDVTTGFEITVPEGWVSLPDSPFAAVLVDAAGNAAGDAFVSTIVATVYPLDPNGPIVLDDVVRDGTLAWLDVTETGRVIQVDRWSNEAAGAEGSIVYASFSNGFLSIVQLSAFALAHGILTRIDLTVDPRKARDAEILLLETLENTLLPTTPAATLVSPEQLIEFQQSIIAKVEPR